MRNRLKCRVLLLVGSTVLVATAMTGCGSGTKVEPAPKSAATMSLTPNADQKNVPVSAELGMAVKNGKVTKVVVTAKGGKAVLGDLRPDGSSWVPRKPLKYETTYTAEVSAVDTKRLPTTAKTSFTTMAKPSQRIEPAMWNNSEGKYGQAAPITLDFPEDFEVPEKQRANVERRLFVTSDPPQAGVWHWFSGTHLEYRPKDFWEPGSTIEVRAALAGLPLGKKTYGKADISRTVHIDKTRRSIEIDNKDKQMVAKKNGKVVKKMPISLGKPSKPSYSGTMIVMEKFESIMFDTTAECGGQVSGDNCYRTPVDFAERLTWSGQFIHSAPWSVGDQGFTNVSHGCVNASPSDAEWVYHFSHVGDPVIITGTEEHLPYGDGYSAYDLSWKDFLAGSYLHNKKADNPDEQD